MAHSVGFSDWNPATDVSPETDSPQHGLLGRRDVTFALTALLFIAAILLPISVEILDLLWVCSLCFTGAIILIACSAKDVTELNGFAVLSASGIFFKMLVSVLTVKTIFLYQTGGLFVKIPGQLLGFYHPVLILILLPIILILLFQLVYYCSGKITKISDHFLNEILPLKQIGIETDLNTGIIDFNQAEHLKERIFSEGRFHHNMAGLARIMVSNTALMYFILLLTAIGQICLSAIHSVTEHISQNAILSLVTGSVIIITLPITLLSLTLMYVCQKFSTRLNATQENDTSEQIEFDSHASRKTETVELLNPDFAEVARNHNLKLLDEAPQKAQESNPTSIMDLLNSEFNTKPDMIEPAGNDPFDTHEDHAMPIDTSKDDCFEPELTKPENDEDEFRIIPIAHRFSSLEDYYNDITATLLDLKGKHQPVLFAGTSFEDLPVTAVVNSAMGCAEKGKTILLIDFDSERKPLQKVFDITETNPDQPTQTCIESISIFTANNETVAEFISEFKSHYDVILIYAPSFIESGYRDQILQQSRTSIIFTAEYIDDDQSYQMIAESACKPIAVMLPPDKALTD